MFKDMPDHLQPRIVYLNELITADPSFLQDGNLDCAAKVAEIVGADGTNRWNVDADGRVFWTYYPKKP